MCVKSIIFDLDEKGVWIIVNKDKYICLLDSSGTSYPIVFNEWKFGEVQGVSLEEWVLKSLT